MIKKLLLILSFVLCLFVGNAEAQSIQPILGAQVYKDISHSKVVFESRGANSGPYESVDILIIDNKPAIRIEYGSTNEYGFVDEDAMKMLFFVLTDIHHDFDGTKATWTGLAANKNIRNGSPIDFCITLHSDDRMSIVIGATTLYCHQIKNYNLDLFDKYYAPLGSSQQSSSTPQKSSKRKTPNKSKGTTKPPLKK